MYQDPKPPIETDEPTEQPKEDQPSTSLDDPPASDQLPPDDGGETPTKPPGSP